MSRVFANGPGDMGSVLGHIIPKTLKMVLDTSFLNTQQYKVCIKGKVEQSKERSNALPYTSVVVAIETLDTNLIMLNVKQEGIKYHFLSLWYDSTWDWTPLSRAINKHSTTKPTGRSTCQSTYLNCHIFIICYNWTKRIRHKEEISLQQTLPNHIRTKVSTVNHLRPTEFLSKIFHEVCWKTNKKTNK